MRRPSSIGIEATTVIAMLLAPSAGQAAAWTKDGHKGGVTVYTAPAEGSAVPRVKAVTTVEAGTDVVWAGLGKALSHTKGLKQIERLGSCGENCEYVYQRLGNPLIKDRHYVLKMRWSVEEKDGARTYRRSWAVTTEKPVIGTGAILVDKVSGSWTVAPVDGGKATRITYVNHMDLGGNVPASLFSKGFVDTAYKLLGKLRKSF